MKFLIFVFALYSFLFSDDSCPNVVFGKQIKQTVFYFSAQSSPASSDDLKPFYNCGAGLIQTMYLANKIDGNYYYASRNTFYEVLTQCPEGQVKSPEGICKTPDCPPGYIKDASGLYCVPDPCPVGTDRDPVTWHCIPKKCPPPQILLKDGLCHNPCPTGSVRMADLQCHWQCSHWSQSECGNYLDPSGQHCVWSSPPLFGAGFNYSMSCMTESQQSQNFSQYPFVPLSSVPVPKLPDFVPQPIKPADPLPLEPVPPKPINDPNYTPPVTPKPVDPLPLEPVPTPKPVPEPEYVPQVPPLVPISPDVPASTPTPSPTPDPTPSPLPTPTPSPVVNPTPSPLPTPTPSPVVNPTPSPTPLPIPTPSPVVNPTPSPTPLPTPTPSPTPDPSSTPDPNTVVDSPSPSPTPYTDTNLPYTSMPNVPEMLDFSIDDMDKFRYDATLLTNNLLDQVNNVQTTFINTKNLLDQGFQPVQISSGTCGNTLAFNFYGKNIDLCPPLAVSGAKFSPIFQLFTFLYGVFLAIRIFIFALKD